MQGVKECGYSVEMIRNGAGLFVAFDDIDALGTDSKMIATIFLVSQIQAQIHYNYGMHCHGDR